MINFTYKTKVYLMGSSRRDSNYSCWNNLEMICRAFLCIEVTCSFEDCSKLIQLNWGSVKGRMARKRLLRMV